MNSTWIALITALIVATGGGAGWAAFRTIKGAKAELFAGARKLNAEADGLAVDSLQDVLRVYIDELKACQSGRSELRQQLVEKEGVLQEQGRLLAAQGTRIAELEEHVAMLEERRGDWRRGQPSD